MVKQRAKAISQPKIDFEPGRVIFMAVVVGVLTLVLFGALTTL